MDPLLKSFFYLLVTTYNISNLLKKVCNSSNFLILVTIKKFIDLKSKTKYTSQKKKKKDAQRQKLPVKFKKKKKTKLN